MILSVHNAFRKEATLSNLNVSRGDWASKTKHIMERSPALISQFARLSGVSLLDSSLRETMFTVMVSTCRNTFTRDWFRKVLDQVKAADAKRKDTKRSKKQSKTGPHGGRRGTHRALVLEAANNARRIANSISSSSSSNSLDSVAPIDPDESADEMDTNVDDQDDNAFAWPDMDWAPEVDVSFPPTRKRPPDSAESLDPVEPKRHKRKSH